jgi:hypothetical protein
MPKRIYNGSHREVELILPDGERQIVARGESTGDIPQETADNLDAQGTWLKDKPAKDKSPDPIESAPVAGGKE